MSLLTSVMLRALSFVSIFLLCSCFDNINRGYIFPKGTDIKTLVKVGMDKEEVIGILSTPSLELENKMYYVSYTNKPTPFGVERRISKQSLIIDLKNDVVSNVSFNDEKY